MAIADQPPDRAVGHGGARDQPAAAQVPVARSAPRWAWLCLLSGLALVLLASGTLGAAGLLTGRYERAVNRETLLSPQTRDDNPIGPVGRVQGPLNYLLIGSDFRERNPADGQRSDTVIIAHVPASLDRAFLISVPRDLLVDIPAYEPTNFLGDRTKINAAFQYGGGGRGGAQLLAQTLTGLVKTRFNGAAIIDFNGFRRAVDVLGSVYLCVDQPATSNHLAYDRTGKLIEAWADERGQIQGLTQGARPVQYEPGCRRMTGALALDYTRIRYGLPNGDYDRQRHQQQFLQAILAETVSQGILANPLKLDKFLRAVGSALTVDTGDDQLAELAFALRRVTPSTLVGVTIPSYPQMIGKTSYVVPDPLAESLYQAIRADDVQTWTERHPAWVNHL